MRADGLNRIEAIKDAVFLAAQDVSVNDDLSTLNFPDSAHLPMDRLDLKSASCRALAREQMP